MSRDEFATMIKIKMTIYENELNDNDIFDDDMMMRMSLCCRDSFLLNCN